MNHYVPDGHQRRVPRLVGLRVVAGGGGGRPPPGLEGGHHSSHAEVVLISNHYYILLLHCRENTHTHCTKAYSTVTVV